MDTYTRPHFATSALVSIDTQCDVLDGGSLEVPGTTTALTGIEVLVRAYREASRPIVHAVRLYLPDGSNVDPCRRHAVETGAETLIARTAGSQLAPALLADPESVLDADALLAGEMQPLGPGEVALYKPRWGAFFETSLKSRLEEKGVDTLVFCGCNFPNCPRTSIYEASERDYRIVLVRDAISGLYEQGEREMTNIGVNLMSAADVVSALSQLGLATAS